MEERIHPNRIHQALNHLIPSEQFYYFETIDSTNLFLKQHPQIKENTFSCCIAEEQTAGHGRFGKPWFSQKKGNIYCSIGVNIDDIKQNLSGLGLMVGLATLKTIQPYLTAPLLALKWPNDILCENKKICGILIEKSDLSLIIGIGINIHPPLPHHSPDPNKPWGAISEFSSYQIDRTQLFIDLIESFSTDLKRFLQYGLSDFMKEWHEVDYLLDKKIKLSIQEQEHIGFARGITEHGLLRFEDLKGEMHFLTSGDASLLNFL